MLKVAYNSIFLRKEAAARFGKEADLLAAIGSRCFFCEDDWLYQEAAMNPTDATAIVERLTKAGFVPGRDFSGASARYSVQKAPWLNIVRLKGRRDDNEFFIEAVRHEHDPGLVICLAGTSSDFDGLSVWQQATDGTAEASVEIRAVPEPWMRHA